MPKSKAEVSNSPTEFTVGLRDSSGTVVVGRPVTEAADPKAAADAIVAEIEAGLALRGKRNRAN